MSENKLYVLVLITVMDRAGAETVMMNYLRNINREKIQIDFLINRPDKADYEDEIKELGSRVYHMCPLYPFKFRKYQKEFKKFLEEHSEYKIIHSHLEERSYFALKIAKEMGVPVRIVHAHSTPKHFNIKLPVRHYFRKKLKGIYTHAFACSEEPAKWLYGTTENVIFMRNAIDVSKFSFCGETRETVRKQLGINEETLVIGHVGRFTYEKNHSFLIEIFNNVNKQHPNSKLLLIGGGKPKEEIEMKAIIKQKVQELGLQGKVLFMGVRDDVAKLMQAMDWLVMPSVSEGFPVTLVEAQAAGVKCLVSDAITDKCNITGEMQFMSLDSDADVWASEIVSFGKVMLSDRIMTRDKVMSSDNVTLPDKGMSSNKVKESDKFVSSGKAKPDKMDMNEKVRQAGYDIKENAKWLEEFYEVVCEKQRSGKI